MARTAGPSPRCCSGRPTNAGPCWGRVAVDDRVELRRAARAVCGGGGETVHPRRM